MKTILSLLLALISITAYAQPSPFEILLAQGKAQFKKDFDDQDYAQAVTDLEKAVKLKDYNAEAHYFLGYAYSRLNSKDATDMPQMSVELTLKASEQLETVNRISPKYKGEMVLLDPYTKISAEWGSLAVNYKLYNKTDSALWAFSEGRKRGGFSDFALALNRSILAGCSRNAILFSLGDSYSFPLFYLQAVEGLRTDVTVVDVSLLNTVWFPRLLEQNKQVSFGWPAATRDTLQYCVWEDSTMTIKTLQWAVKPDYGESYLLRGSRLMLQLFKQNNFQRELAFTPGFSDAWRLSLKDEALLHDITTDKLIPVVRMDNSGFVVYKERLRAALQLAKLVNKNSTEELRSLDQIRYNVFRNITKLLADKDKPKAREVMKLMDELANEKDYPFQDEEGDAYVKYLKTLL